MTRFDAVQQSDEVLNLKNTFGLAAHLFALAHIRWVQAAMIFRAPR